MNLTPTAKIALKRPKSAKKAPNVAVSTKKKFDCTSKMKVDCVHRQVSKVFEPDPNPKGPKSAKKAPNFAALKTYR